jgi:hypothetical protein
MHQQRELSEESACQIRFLFQAGKKYAEVSDCARHPFCRAPRAKGDAERNEGKRVLFNLDPAIPAVPLVSEAKEHAPGSLAQPHEVMLELPSQGRDPAAVLGLRLPPGP